MQFTHRAVLALSRIMDGCITGLEWKRYLRSLSEKMFDKAEFDDLEKKYRAIAVVCAQECLFDQMRREYEEQKVFLIDERDVYRFFAGEAHLKKAMAGDRVVKGLLSIRKRAMLVLTDMLLPVSILGVDDEGLVEAKYNNGKLSFVIKNLVLRKGLSLKSGDMALVHFASIVGKCNRSTANELLRLQSCMKDFEVEAKRVKLIDVMKLDQFTIVSKGG